MVGGNSKDMVIFNILIVCWNHNLIKFNLCSKSQTIVKYILDSDLVWLIQLMFIYFKVRKVCCVGDEGVKLLTLNAYYLSLNHFCVKLIFKISV